MHCDLAPEPWIVRFAHLVPSSARLLDVAAGQGRHSRLFAAQGAQVLAVDRDAASLASLEGVANVRTLVTDLEQGEWPLRDARFDAIVTVNYLHRPLLPMLLSSLTEQGTLLYQTFARGNEAYGSPRRPDFLLEPDELLQFAAGRLRVVAFEQGHVVRAGREAVVQCLAAVGLARAWPAAIDVFGHVG
jgi:SAM-dependent methyltransferase